MRSKLVLIFLNYFRQERNKELCILKQCLNNIVRTITDGRKIARIDYFGFVCWKVVLSSH